MADVIQQPVTPPVNPPDNGDDKSGGDNRYQPAEELLHGFTYSLRVAATDAEIQPIMAEHGYPTERIKEMQDHVEEVRTLFDSKDVSHGGQLKASKDFNDKRGGTDKSFKKTFKVAKELFKDDPQAISSLLLKGRRKVTISGWIRQTETFYKNLLSSPDLLKVMAQYGYPETKLSDELKMVQEVVEADINHRKEFGVSVEATADRDTELEILEEEMTRFYNIAKAVLSDDPRLIEKLKVI